MNRSLSKLSIILFVGLLSSLWLVPISGMAQEVKMITAQGQAFMQARDPAIARDEAIADGLRNAVKQAVGTMVDSETIVNNFQLISDKIYENTKGYVRNYKIDREWKDEDNVINVMVIAEVAIGNLQKDVDAIRHLLEQKNMPRIMVIINENNVGQIGQWLASANMSTSETEITNRFLSK